MATIRVQGKDGRWKPFQCTPSEQTGEACTLRVPALDGLWLIHSAGMTANIGGSDWRIYHLHPEDCAELCKQPTSS